MAKRASKPAAPAPADRPRTIVQYSGRAEIPHPHEATARHHERRATEHAELAKAYRNLARKGAK